MGRRKQFKKCLEPGCKAMVTGRVLRCDSCRAVAVDRNILKGTKALTERRKAERALNPILCKEDGCETAVIGKSHRCEECKKKIGHKKLSGFQREQIEKAAVVFIVPEKPKPRRAPPVLVTTAEQMQIDREQREREEALRKTTMENFGLIVVPGRPVASKVRHLSAKEIAEAQAKYTPPVKVSFFATERLCSWD